MFSTDEDTDYVQADQIGEMTILRAIGPDAERLEGVVPDWMLQVVLSVNGTLYVPPVYQIAPVAMTQKRAEDEKADTFEDSLGNSYVEAEWLEEQCPVAAATIDRIRRTLRGSGYPCVA